MVTHKTPYQRHTIRLPEYDYSSRGFYFVTISTQNGKHYFGEVSNAVMIVNDAGRMIERAWEALPSRFQNISTEIHKVMPNHFHGIIGINKQGYKKLGEYIGAFKSLTTKDYTFGVRNYAWEPFAKKLWNMNYYEHIIRDDDEYARIFEYIQDNVLKWDATHSEKMP